MQRAAITNSSNIVSAGFDPQTNQIEVEFYHGGIWRFPGDANIYRDLMLATSAGKFVNARLKPRGGVKIK